MAVLREFYKDALPDVPVRNSRYFIKNADYVEVYEVDGEGVIKKQGNSSMISELIAATPGFIPAGGSTGQVIKKNSSTSYDYSWGTDNTGGGGSSSMVSVVAAANLLQYQPIVTSGVVANSANTAHRNKLVGLAAADIANTTSGNVQPEGLITNPAWAWTKGDTIFVNGTSLSATAPSTGWCQKIGLAVSTDTILIEIGIAVLL